VETALHEAVAAPREDELGAPLERALDLLRSLVALRHLRPEGLVETSLLERAAQPQQPVAEGLPRVGDHGDLGHRFSASAMPAARQHRTRTATAATPTTAPPRQS